LTYDSQILEILTSIGDKGISVQLLAKHIYNKNVSLFYTPNLEEIHAYVQQYLLKNSKSSSSLIEKTGRRGYYRLNTKNNANARQLLIEFQAARQVKEKTEKEEKKPVEDLSLSLFD